MVAGNVVEYQYVKGQEKRIEKKYDNLMKEYRALMKEGEIDRIRKIYQKLLEKKKVGKLDWTEEIMLEIYRDAIKLEKRK